jgi:hypothetical protein
VRLAEGSTKTNGLGTIEILFVAANTDGSFQEGGIYDPRVDEAKVPPCLKEIMCGTPVPAGGFCRS